MKRTLHIDLTSRTRTSVVKPSMWCAVVFFDIGDREPAVGAPKGDLTT